MWDEIIKDWKGQKESKNQYSKRALAKKFIEQPFDMFSKRAFESQLSDMADALSSLEVVQIFQFYDRLEGIENIRAKLEYLMQTQIEESRHATSDNSSGFSRVLKFFPHQPFNEHAENLWDECESLVSQVFAKGNPIRKL